MYETSGSQFFRTTSSSIGTSRHRVIQISHGQSSQTFQGYYKFGLSQRRFIIMVQTKEIPMT